MEVLILFTLFMPFLAHSSPVSTASSVGWTTASDVNRTSVTASFRASNASAVHHSVITHAPLMLDIKHFINATSSSGLHGLSASTTGDALTSTSSMDLLALSMVNSSTPATTTPTLPTAKSASGMSTVAVSLINSNWTSDSVPSTVSFKKSSEVAEQTSSGPWVSSSSSPPMSDPFATEFESNYSARFRRFGEDFGRASNVSSRISHWFIENFPDDGHHLATSLDSLLELVDSRSRDGDVKIETFLVSAFDHADGDNDDLRFNFTDAFDRFWNFTLHNLKEESTSMSSPLSLLAEGRALHSVDSSFEHDEHVDVMLLAFEEWLNVTYADKCSMGTTRAGCMKFLKALERCLKGVSLPDSIKSAGRINDDVEKCGMPTCGLIQDVELPDPFHHDVDIGSGEFLLQRSMDLGAMKERLSTNGTTEHRPSRAEDDLKLNHSAPVGRSGFVTAKAFNASASDDGEGASSEESKGNAGQEEIDREKKIPEKSDENSGKEDVEEKNAEDESPMMIMSNDEDLDQNAKSYASRGEESSALSQDNRGFDEAELKDLESDLGSEAQEFKMLMDMDVAELHRNRTTTVDIEDHGEQQQQYRPRARAFKVLEGNDTASDLELPMTMMQDNSSTLAPQEKIRIEAIDQLSSSIANLSSVSTITTPVTSTTGSIEEPTAAAAAVAAAASTTSSGTTTSAIVKLAEAPPAPAYGLAYGYGRDMEPPKYYHTTAAYVAPTYAPAYGRDMAQPPYYQTTAVYYKTTAAYSAYGRNLPIHDRAINSTTFTDDGSNVTSIGGEALHGPVEESFQSVSTANGSHASDNGTSNSSMVAHGRSMGQDFFGGGAGNRQTSKNTESDDQTLGVGRMEFGDQKEEDAFGSHRGFQDFLDGHHDSRDRGEDEDEDEQRPSQDEDDGSDRRSQDADSESDADSGSKKTYSKSDASRSQDENARKSKDSETADTDEGKKAYSKSQVDSDDRRSQDRDEDSSVKSQSRDKDYSVNADRQSQDATSKSDSKSQKDYSKDDSRAQDANSRSDDAGSSQDEEDYQSQHRSKDDSAKQHLHVKGHSESHQSRDDDLDADFSSQRHSEFKDYGGLEFRSLDAESQRVKETSPNGTEAEYKGGIKARAGHFGGNLKPDNASASELNVSMTIMHDNSRALAPEDKIWNKFTSSVANLPSASATTTSVSYTAMAPTSTTTTKTAAPIVKLDEASPAPAYGYGRDMEPPKYYHTTAAYAAPTYAPAYGRDMEQLPYYYTTAAYYKTTAAYSAYGRNLPIHDHAMNSTFAEQGSNSTAVIEDLVQQDSIKEDHANESRNDFLSALPDNSDVTPPNTNASSTWMDKMPMNNDSSTKASRESKAEFAGRASGDNMTVAEVSEEAPTTIRPVSSTIRNDNQEVLPEIPQFPDFAQATSSERIDVNTTTTASVIVTTPSIGFSTSTLFAVTEETTLVGEERQPGEAVVSLTSTTTLSSDPDVQSAPDFESSSTQVSESLPRFSNTTSINDSSSPITKALELTSISSVSPASSADSSTNFTNSQEFASTASQSLATLKRIEETASSPSSSTPSSSTTKVQSVLVDGASNSESSGYLIASHYHHHHEHHQDHRKHHEQDNADDYKEKKKQEESGYNPFSDTSEAVYGESLPFRPLKMSSSMTVLCRVDEDCDQARFEVCVVNGYYNFCDCPLYYQRHPITRLCVDRLEPFSGFLDREKRELNFPNYDYDVFSSPVRCSNDLCSNRGECHTQTKNATGTMCICYDWYFGTKCEVDGMVVVLTILASTCAMSILALFITSLYCWQRRSHKGWHLVSMS